MTASQECVGSTECWLRRLSVLMPDPTVRVGCVGMVDGLASVGPFGTGFGVKGVFHSVDAVMFRQFNRVWQTTCD